MELIFGAVQLIVSLILALIFGLWFVSLALAWSWAQQRSLQRQTPISLTDVLAIASIEWGAFLTALILQAIPRRPVYEAPPIQSGESPVSHYPVILIPSLHLNSGLFHILHWRLKKHHYKSLWLFDWPIFLSEASLLEEELLRFIVSRISKTRSPKITLISFGTSGPVVARVVSRPELASVAVKWVAISAPVKACASLSFLKSRRWKSSLELKTNSTRVPHQLAVGERDTVCYPEEVFGKEPDLTIPDVGHYGALLHSSTTQFVLNVLKQ